MDSKLLKTLVDTFKRFDFEVAKGSNFVSLVGWGVTNVNAVRVSRELERILDSVEFISYTFEADEISSDKRDAEFSILYSDSRNFVCGVAVSTMRAADITTIVIYW